VADFYAKVEAGQITRINVTPKQARVNQINFPSNPTDADFRAIGYWPITGTRPTAGEWQRVTGPTYVVNAQTETVAREYTTTDYTLAERKAEMIAEITAKRWSVETSGITVSSVPVATDAQTQAKLSGALQLVQADDTVLIDWKGSDGTWSQLNASAVTTIAMAVGSHVQACFTREKELHTAVDNAVDSDALDLIDIEAGSVTGSGSWPN
jgi:hypothetical protein